MVLSQNLGGQEVIVGDLVRLKTSSRHLLHEFMCLLGQSLVQVGLENSVVADHIHEVKLLHFFKELLGTIEVAALHACIKKAIVDHRSWGNFAARANFFKHAPGTGQVALTSMGFDHPSVALQLIFATSVVGVGGCLLCEALIESLH